MEYFNIENRRYLGSKAKLVDFISKIVKENCANHSSFMDLFGGTGNVAWAFNDSKTKIIINDILESNYFAYLTFFSNKSVDTKKIEKILNEYNSCHPLKQNYFSKNFANTYFSLENCKKIGFIRDDIEKRFKNGSINEREKAILITSLIYAMDHIANTVGHYDAYRANGDLDKELILKMPNVPPEGTNKLNEIYLSNSNELVKHVGADIVYIDPPYNSRQYCDAYHLLENVAEWKKPEVFGVAKKMKRGGNLKSDYCTQKAPIAFDNLIQNIQAKYILVSYNNMGSKGAGRSNAKISDEDIIGSLNKRGKVEIFSVPFNQFTTGKTNIENHQERLFVCYVGKFDQPEKTKKSDVGELAKSPLNYTGGKFKLLPQLLLKFDNARLRFIDVFGGGFNVGANVSQREIVYNDKETRVERLIQLIYKKDFSDIVEKIKNIIRKYNLSDSTLFSYEHYGCESSSGLGRYNKQQYEKLRSHYNSLKTSEEKDFELLTLIFFSFNNQIRFNSSGDFNMPVGKRDFNFKSIKHLKEFSAKIKTKNVSFESKDFRKLFAEAGKDSFVYCDPPYYLGLASYNESNGWTETDEKDLLSGLKNLDEKGIHFALSNLIEHNGVEHKMLVDWTKKNRFNTIYIKSNYSNSNYHKNIKGHIGKSIEVLITNY